MYMERAWGGNKFMIQKNIFLFSILHLFILSAYLFAQNIQGYNTGRESGQIAHENFANKSAVNSNVFVPAMSGTTQMRTLDGSKSFDGRMMCQSRQAAATITFLPAGSGAYRLIIKQDTNFDGSLEYVYDTSSIGSSLNGVCTGGVVAGNLKYVWVNSSSGIILESLNSSNALILGSCYSSSSGSDAYITIGSGIAKAINVTQTDPLKKILTDGKFDVATYTYTMDAILPTPCSQINSVNAGNPSSYYNSQTYPTTDSTQITMSEGVGGIYGRTTGMSDSVGSGVGSSEGTTALTGRKLLTCLKKNTLNITTLSIDHFNNCQQYENNPQCSIKEKNLCKTSGRDCISVISNSVADRLVPSVLCEDINATFSYCTTGSSAYYINNGSRLNIENSNDIWMYAKYTYKCENGATEFASSKTTNTMHTTSLSTTESGLNTMYYKDFNNTQSSTSLPDTETCLVKRCAVKRISSTSQAQGPVIYESDYKECSKSGADWICALSSGEEMIENCACQPGNTGMQTTLGALSGVEQAAKDIICSTN